MELNAKQRNLIQEALLNFDEAKVYSHYSGRSMYGKECFGITTEQYTNPISVIVELTIDLMDNEEEDLARELADRVSQDNMGLGTITYFPSTEWGEAEVLDDDEDWDDD